MSMVDLIKGCPLFLELYDEEIEKILKNCVVTKFKKKDIIIHENDEGRDFYVILAGSAEVTKTVRGKEMHINDLKKGDIFGETVLINETKRPTTITAKSNCDVLIIDYDSIFSMYQKNTKIFALLILNLARMLTKRLRSSNKAISAISDKIKKAA